MDSDNTDSRFTLTNFFGPTRSPLFYIQPVMDNTDSANADFRLTHTTFSTHCHQNTSVNMDCVAVWTPELWPVIVIIMISKQARNSCSCGCL